MKTTAPNQLWQSDASYFFVVGWGWYYSILVLDDFSRFVLASDLKPDMTAHSISDVVEQAVAFTGMRQVPVEDRTKFLSDHGSGYLARVFEEYLRVVGIRHIYCAPHHPQTNGKIERFHETLKARMNLLVYTSPERAAPNHAGLHRVLQPSPLSRSHWQRDPGGCVLRTAGRNLTQESRTETTHD